MNTTIEEISKQVYDLQTTCINNIDVHVISIRLFNTALPEVHLLEDSFRKTFPEYFVKNFTPTEYTEYKYELYVEIGQVIFFCISREA